MARFADDTCLLPVSGTKKDASEKLEEALNLSYPKSCPKLFFHETNKEYIICFVTEIRAQATDENM